MVHHKQGFRIKTPVSYKVQRLVAIARDLPFARLFQRRYDAELLHQPKCIELSPIFHDLLLFQTVYNDTIDAYSFFSRWRPHKCTPDACRASPSAPPPYRLLQ